MNKKFCISKKLLMISFVFVVLIGFVYFVTDTLNKGKQLTSSSAKEKVSISSALNSDSQIATLKKSTVFKNFKFDTKESENSRNNKYYFLANIIVNLKQNNSLSSASILNDLYKNYYLKGKSPNEAYQKIIEKNFNNISAILINTIGSNPFKNVVGSSPAPTAISFPKCSFWEWLNHKNWMRCFCLGQFSLNTCRGVGSPLQEAQKVGLNYAALSGVTIDPAFIESLNRIFQAYNIASNLFNITVPSKTNTGVDTIGYNLGNPDLHLSEDQQLSVVADLINEAQNNSQPIPIEVEVGYGYQFNSCAINTLCVKVDLSPTGEAAAVQDIVNSSGFNGETGMTVWLKGNFNTMTTELIGSSLTGVNRVYQIAPFGGDQDDPTDISSFLWSSFNTVKQGGEIFIIPLPQSYDSIYGKVQALGSTNIIIDTRYLSGFQTDPNYGDLSFIKNFNSDYFTGLSPEQIPVILVIKK